MSGVATGACNKTHDDMQADDAVTCMQPACVCASGKERYYGSARLHYVRACACKAAAAGFSSCIDCLERI